MSCWSDAPFGHSVPRLIGWSGSPSTCTTCGIAFFARSPSVWMMTPQLTEQYGHVLRVSLVRAIFSVFACAYAGAMSNPNAETAAPAAADFKNVRREMAILRVFVATCLSEEHTSELQ